jgi:hypothetical protein
VHSQGGKQMVGRYKRDARKASPPAPPFSLNLDRYLRIQFIVSHFRPLIVTCKHLLSYSIIYRSVSTLISLALSLLVSYVTLSTNRCIAYNGGSGSSTGIAAPGASSTTTKFAYSSCRSFPLDTREPPSSSACLTHNPSARNLQVHSAK